ncbi:MAG: ABC-F family ATP-binding cassette domain-containing protein, partial [Chloroflexota bacterium]
MHLRVERVAVAYGATPVLNDISFTLNANDRAGIIGANGAGKSTLLKIISGDIAPDSGMVQFPPQATLGYLPQEVATPAGKTIQHMLDDALTYIHNMAATLRDLETQMAQPDIDLDDVFARYDTATIAFERAGGYEADARVDTVLAGLGLADIDRHRHIETLSGGERARVGLAMMLVQSPDVLLLDEPTNHLDVSALAWLEDYLAAYQGSVLLVSHDRVFLNRTVNRIIEIDEHSRTAVLFSGNYEAYTAEKARRLAKWREDYAQQQDELKTLRRLLKRKTSTTTQKRNIRTKDGDKFIKHFKDQTADKTLAREAASLEERLSRIEADPIPQPPRSVALSPDYDPATLRGHFPVMLDHLSLRYGQHVILDNVSLSIGAGERLAIVGENGAGKSSLLKLIAGEIAPDSGSVTTAPSVRLGYLPQVDALPDGDTLIAAYGNGLPGGYEDHKAALISSGFFTYEQLNTPINGTSAGQRRKIQ